MWLDLQKTDQIVTKTEIQIKANNYDTLMHACTVKKHQVCGYR